MSAKAPSVWCADLIAAVDPQAAQDAATPEAAALALANEVWSAQDQTVRLAGAANEVLHFQLVVEKRAGQLKAFSLDGAPVQAALYQNIAVPVGGKFYDDALVPIDPASCGDAVAAASRRAPRLPAPRQRQTFTVELYVPKGTPAGAKAMTLTVKTTGREFRLRLDLTVYGFELPDEPGCTADINNYSRSLANGLDIPDDDLEGYLAVERQYFRMAREHRALLHLLPYGHSGRQEPEFAPVLAGRGRTRRIEDWTPFDRHWGAYLDGSAFQGARGGPRPIEYLYLPVNSNWPAYFEKYGTPGYWFEYQKVLGEMAAHFTERGWTRTQFEVFFNHKTRWKYFPWDMDEIRFDRDNYATIEYGRKALEAVKDYPKVRFVNRIDSSWIFERSALSEIGDVVGLWVVNRSYHGSAPDASAHLRAKGQKVWFYGGAGGIAAPERMDSLRWGWMAWGRDTDGFCWWNGVGWGSWENVGSGGAHCFYPGKRFGIQGPLASMRLKVLLRTMQDHAYLTLFTQRAGRAAADALIGRTLGATCREDWYQRGERREGGGADIQTRSASTKPWNTAGRALFNTARAEVARAIEKK